MTEDDASKTLCDFLEKLAADAILINPAREVLGEIIKDHPGAPRPSGQYCMVEFITDRDLDEFNDERFSDITVGTGPAAEDRVVMCKSRGVEWLFRVNLYASRPMDWARLFAAGLRSAEACVWMAPLVVRDVRDIKRAPELIQQEWEGRAMFEVALGAVATEPLLVDVIEQGTVITEGAGGSTVTTSISYAKP
jgi:hypothetical protein